MKLIKTFALTFALIWTPACLSTLPGTLETEGAFSSVTERVLDRHDAYLLSDEGLTGHEAQLYGAESSGVRFLLVMPEVSADVLSKRLEPVMVRHDAYVSGDLDLDALERSLYLGATERLRSLLDTVKNPVK